MLEPRELAAGSLLGLFDNKTNQKAAPKAPPPSVSVSAAATPLVLYPANGRYVPIKVVGTVEVRHDLSVPKVTYQVVDEYKLNERLSAVRIRPVRGEPHTYQFAFQLRLPASVASSDKSGRQFYLTVAATIPNTSNGKVFPVLVPNPSWGAPPKA